MYCEGGGYGCLEERKRERIQRQRVAPLSSEARQWSKEAPLSSEARQQSEEAWYSVEVTRSLRAAWNGSEELRQLDSRMGPDAHKRESRPIIESTVESSQGK